MDEQTQRQVGRALAFEHISHALRRLGLADICKCEWIPAERGGEHPKHEAGEILLHADDANAVCRRKLFGCWRRRSTWPALRWPRVRLLNEIIAVESGGGGTAFLRRNLVLPDVLVRQLDGNFEFDGNQVLATHLTRAAGRQDRLD
jgi:hypothetical protein